MFDKLKHMKIMVDIDDVLCKCNSPFYWFASNFCTTNFLNKKLKYHPVNPAVARKYKNHLSFFKFCNEEHLIPLEGCVEALKKWKNQGIEIHIVSRKPKLKSFQKCTVDWLRKHDIPFNSLVLSCTNKPVYCLRNNFDLVIDDSLTNCSHSSELGMVAVWLTKSEEFPQDQFGPNFFISQHWKEIDPIVQELYNSMEEYLL